MWQLTISVNHSSKEHTITCTYIRYQARVDITKLYCDIHSLRTIHRCWQGIASAQRWRWIDCYSADQRKHRYRRSWIKWNKNYTFTDYSRLRVSLEILIQLTPKIKALHCFSFINLYIVLLSCFENNRFRGTCIWLGIHVLLVI